MSLVMLLRCLEREQSTFITALRGRKDSLEVRLGQTVADSHFNSSTCVDDAATALSRTSGRVRPMIKRTKVTIRLTGLLIGVRDSGREGWIIVYI